MTGDEARRADERAFLQENAYRILSGSALLLLATGTVVFHALEDWGWVDSFYFSSIAVTTVGFGDLVPTTDGAKIFSVFYVFTGVAIITSFLNARLQRHARSVANRVRQASQ